MVIGFWDRVLAMIYCAKLSGLKIMAKKISANWGSLSANQGKGSDEVAGRRGLLAAILMKHRGNRFRFGLIKIHFINQYNELCNA